MLVCLPTIGDSGLEDKLSDHFGSAPFFTLYESESEKLEIIKNRNSSHSHGTCHPMTQLKKYHLNSIICSGIGRRAIEMLNAEGIKVYQADSKIVKEAVEQIKSGNLSEIDASKACKGHGQRQGIIHDCAHSRGLRNRKAGN